MTGKRECPDSTANSTSLSDDSSRSTNTICERGTMMSRTCMSATANTPSIITSASPLNRPRSLASRRSSMSSARSRGSPDIDCVMRLNQRPVLPWGGSDMGDQDTRSGIRIQKAKPIKDLNLPYLHLFGLGTPFMVEAHEVQDPMDRHVRPVRRGGFTLSFGFMRHHQRAKHQLAQKVPAVRGHPGALEGQHIGRPIAVPVAEIQAAAARRADHQDGQGEIGRAH